MSVISIILAVLGTNQVFPVWILWRGYVICITSKIIISGKLIWVNFSKLF